MARQRAQAVLVPSDRLFYDGRVALLTAAGKYALLAMTTNKKMLEEGALVFFTNLNAEQD